jgi:hypothetical protein
MKESISRRRFLEASLLGGAGASVELAVPITRGSETNLLSKKLAEVSCNAGKLNFELQPWRLRTFEIDL